jgi:hypothetical protein
MYYLPRPFVGDRRGDHAASRSATSGVPLRRVAHAARPSGCQGMQDRPALREDADEADADVVCIDHNGSSVLRRNAYFGSSLLLCPADNPLNQCGEIAQTTEAASRSCRASHRSAASIHTRSICRKMARSRSERAVCAHSRHSFAFSRYSLADATTQARIGRRPRPHNAAAKAAVLIKSLQIIQMLSKDGRTLRQAYKLDFMRSLGACAYPGLNCGGLADVERVRAPPECQGGSEIQAGLRRAVPMCFSTTVSVSRMAPIATETPAQVLDRLIVGVPAGLTAAAYLTRADHFPYRHSSRPLGPVCSHFVHIRKGCLRHAATILQNI